MWANEVSERNLLGGGVSNTAEVETHVWLSG